MWRSCIGLVLTSTVSLSPGNGNAFTNHLFVINNFDSDADDRCVLSISVLYLVALEQTSARRNAVRSGMNSAHSLELRTSSLQLGGSMTAKG